MNFVTIGIPAKGRSYYLVQLLFVPSASPSLESKVEKMTYEARF